VCVCTLGDVTSPLFRLSDMELDFVSLVAAGDDPEARVVIAKADKSTEHGLPSSTLPINKPPEDHVETINKSDLDPEVVAYIEGLESEVDDLSGKVEKAEQDLAARDEQITTLTEKVSKSVPNDPDAARKEMLEKADPALRAYLEEQDAKVSKAEEIAKAERDARLEREFVSKAEALPMISENKQDLAGLLRRISDALTPEDAEKVEKTLAAANEQIAKGNLFGTMGRGGGETTISKSVEGKAAELRKADPTLTQEQAIAQVYNDDPDLFAQAMTDQEG
jgi:plasmid stabilization system protein ParE